MRHFDMPRTVSLLPNSVATLRVVLVCKLGYSTTVSSGLHRMACSEDTRRNSQVGLGDLKSVYVGGLEEVVLSVLVMVAHMNKCSRTFVAVAPARCHTLLHTARLACSLHCVFARHTLRRHKSGRGSRRRCTRGDSHNLDHGNMGRDTLRLPWSETMILTEVENDCCNWRWYERWALA